MRRLSLVLVVGMLFAVGVPGSAVAQTTAGSIQGTVVDQSGAALPGVTISITNTDTSSVRALP